MRANAHVRSSSIARRLAVAVLLAALALVGRGAAGIPPGYADPVETWVLNTNVANSQASAADCTVPGACDLTLAADRQALAADFDTIETQSAGQVAEDAAITAFSGDVIILLQTDGSATNVWLNGRGLDCTPLCDGVATVAPDATDDIAVWAVNDAGTRNRGDTLVVTPIQNAIAINSRSITIVGQAHDLVLTSAKSTIQEAAASCAMTDSTSAPTRSAAAVFYTDIDGTSLVGYSTDWDSKPLGTVLLAAAQTTSQMLADGTTIAAPNVVCGFAPGTTELRAGNTVDGAIAGLTFVRRMLDITVIGVPASMTLTASPAVIPCDGVASSTVTAMVTDSEGNSVADGTNVIFSVVALGTANPINADTVDGSASSTITPLSGATTGVTVIVTSGDAQASIRIDCAVPATPTATNTPPPPTSTPVPTNTPAPGGCLTRTQKIQLIIGIVTHMNAHVGDPDFDPTFDVNGDGVINAKDIVQVAQTPRCPRMR